MGAQGTTTVNFGPFPGSTDCSVAVADSNILVGSLVEAWIYPVATADHTADEHITGQIDVYAGNIVAGVGFTIYAVMRNPATSLDVVVPEQRNPAYYSGGDSCNVINGDNPIVYGLWTVAWCWN